MGSFQYIDPQVQIPQINPESSLLENTPVSVRVIAWYKDRAEFGVYYYDLKCWKLENGAQPADNLLWGYIPTPTKANTLIAR